MRLGILGGTFDPIHAGHLAIAAGVRDLFALDRLLLLPAWVPPHKQGEPITPFPHRFAMSALASLGIDRVAASPEEGMRPGPSFTVDTLARLRETLDPADPLLFVLGSDSLADLPTWRDPQTILSLANLVVAPRGGNDPAAIAAALPGDLAARLVRLGKGEQPRPLPPAGRIYWAALPQVAVSGTEIRRRVREGHPIEGLVPASVAEYISKYELYSERRMPSSSR